MSPLKCLLILLGLFLSASLIVLLFCIVGINVGKGYRSLKENSDLDLNPVNISEYLQDLSKKQHLFKPQKDYYKLSFDNISESTNSIH
ncbi:unknown [Gryllus bimaculatus nudivirus]|uniref:Uncharacterized protein n=1 Tax=Gryllus bimaculatus nudivirus TaxID=432587 RepID=A4L1Z5_9VIRU|nr:hypothetical protein GrBNV_gp32 [Gryllus bimaculatus nudivirus]ABO45365.1 unknown [Gryllus bimaculatus nudivirus]